MMAEMPTIEPARCNGCGLCVEVCHCGVLAIVDNVVKLNIKPECKGCTHWCALCELVCPNGAISYPFDVVIEGT